jgi:hypothetical protein
MARAAIPDPPRVHRASSRAIGSTITTFDMRRICAHDFAIRLGDTGIDRRDDVAGDRRAPAPRHQC